MLLRPLVLQTPQRCRFRDYTQNFEIKRNDEFLQRKKNFGSGSFVANLRDHIHEFLHASMDEHRTCLKETVRKMFEREKLYRENSGGGPNEGEKSLPLQTTTD